RSSVSSVNPRPLPHEFDHPALQELLRRSAALGSIAGAELNEACESAAVAPSRLKVVLRALHDQGVAINTENLTSASVAASQTARKSANALVTDSNSKKPAQKAPAKKTASKSTTKKTATKKTAPAKKTAT